MRFYLHVSISALLLSSTAAAQQKKRVAVLNFDYATVNTTVSAVFGTNTDVGKGISDLLVDRLVQSGKYSVIERKALDKVLAEQNFSNSDRADPASAAKIGRLLGVDAIIIGSITQFGNDDKKTDLGGGALGGITGRFGVSGIKRSKASAVVGLSARMINTDTGEILTTASAKGEASRSGTGVNAAGGSTAALAGGIVDMTSTNFRETVVGEAVTSAVQGLAGQLESKAASLPTKTVVVEGLVADATGDSIIINVGTKAGVKVGDKLSVSRLNREVRDPSSGKVIRRIEDKVGEIVITEADEQSAVGKFTGPAPAKVGDLVKTAQ
jgi:curli biogenesis system outer membrane secretion channel CsgG